MAQGKKTGGRQKGTINKATKALQEKIASTGLTPHDVMIDNMRHAYAEAMKCEAEIGPDVVQDCEDDKAKFEKLLAEVKRAVGYRQIAQECAKDAAPYSHPRLASTEVKHGGHDGGPMTLTVEYVKAIGK
jgi:hypothetical protein